MTVYEISLIKAIKEVEESILIYSDVIYDYLCEINRYQSQKLAEEVLHKKKKYTENQLLTKLMNIQNNIKKCEKDFKLKTENLNKILKEAPKDTVITLAIEEEFNKQLISIMRTYIKIFQDIDDIKNTEYDVLSDNDFGVYDMNESRSKLDISIFNFNKKFNTKLLSTLQAAKESRKMPVEDVVNMLKNKNFER